MVDEDARVRIEADQNPHRLSGVHEYRVLPTGVLRSEGRRRTPAEHLAVPPVCMHRMRLGAGIAVAFVATIYGLVIANIFALPMANKIKRKVAMQAHTKEMILTGALGIVSGMNPFIIEEKLRAYSHGGKKGEKH